MKRWSALVAVALGIAAVAGAPSGAAAQDTERARALFTQGVQALQQGDYATAEHAFQSSYAVLPRAATLCNLALTYDRWPGHAQEALDAYRGCARDDREGRFRPHALERAAAIQASLGTTGPGATAGGGGAGGDGGNSASPAGTASAGTQAGDGSAGGWGASSGGTGGGGSTNPFVPVGGSTIGAPTGRSSTPVATGGTVAEPPGRSHTFLFIGLGALLAGGAAITGGVVFAGQSSATNDRLSTRYPDGRIPATLSDGSINPDVRKLDDARGAKTTSIVLYVIGGALGGLGAALVVLDLSLPGPDASGTALAVSPLPGGAALTAHGRF